jgi:hypothetical protein
LKIYYIIRVSKRGSDMKWVTEIKGKKFAVEARYGKIFVSGAGQLFIDGKQVKAWGASLWGLPKEVPFEIAGTPALLRRRGARDQNFDLLVDGKLVKPVKGG